MVDAVRLAIRHFSFRRAGSGTDREDEPVISGRSLRRTRTAAISTATTFASVRRRILRLSVRDDGLFTVHYVHMAAELWLDSTEGWLAVVDGKSQYAMVERFQYDASKPYPGKASVIFWTNGPEIRLNSDGNPSLSADPDASPYYLEAELNSPMCRLRPGESCTFETEWFPTRSGSEFHGVTDAGIVIRPLRATATENGKIKFRAPLEFFIPGARSPTSTMSMDTAVGVTPIVDVDPEQDRVAGGGD